MEKLFIKLFEMSISASYLILAVLVVRFVLRRAPKKMRSFLWLLVGIRLIVPFSRRWRMDTAMRQDCLYTIQSPIWRYKSLSMSQPRIRIFLLLSQAGRNVRLPLSFARRSGLLESQ